MKSFSILLVIWLLFLGETFSQQFELFDIQTHEPLAVEVIYKDIKGSVVILLKNNDSTCLDSIFFEGLLWRNTAKPAFDQTLILTFPIRRGVGHFYAKLIAIQVSRGKFIQTCHLIYREELKFPRIDPKLETYRVKYEYEEKGQVNLSVTFQLETQDGKKENWREDFEIPFNQKEGIFSNFTFSLKNAVIYQTSESITGQFFGVKE